jgi:hypothetical protein
MIQAMTGLNQNHKRHLLITLEQMDESLCSIEHIMAPGSSSLFTHFLQDTTPEQNEFIKQQIVAIRDLMARTLGGLGISPREPPKNALRMITTKLLFMEVSLMEATARHIRGHGELSRESGMELDKMIGEIRAHVENLRIALQPPRSEVHANAGSI